MALILPGLLPEIRFPSRAGEKLAPVYSEIEGKETDDGATGASCEGGMTMTLKEAKSPPDF
jgi:hypothetical protein